MACNDRVVFLTQELENHGYQYTKIKKEGVTVNGILECYASGTGFERNC